MTGLAPITDHQVIDQAAIIETSGTCPRTTSHHIFAALETHQARESPLLGNRTASGHRDMDNLTIVYRRIDNLDILHHKEEALIQGMPMSSRGYTSQRISRLPLRDDRTGQERESHQEHQATDLESTTKEIGREATLVIQ